MSEFQDTYAKAVILIDNSGSTAAEDTGMTDRETGHELNRLDRHVLTAATYLGAFPDSGDYRIITCYNQDPETKSWHQPYVKDFDNTDESNKLDAKPKHQNVHTGDPKASEFKTKKGDWMTVSQNLKKAKTDEKTEEYQELKDYFKTDGKPKRSELNKYMTKK